MRRHIPILGAFTALIVASAVPMAVAGHSTFAPGDLFVGVGGGKVQWRHPDTTLNRVLSTSTSSPQTTGMALDPAHRLYSTGYTSNSINLFDPTGAAAGTLGAGFNSHPESIAFDTFGNAYVGQEGGSRDILKLGPTGSLLAAYNAATEVKGTDRLDVAGDQCTVLYTSQGTAVKRFNACSNTQLSDLATGLPGTAAFDVKALLTGGVLVADSQTIVRLDASGSIVQQYDPDPAQNNCWTALTLGTTTDHFWAGDRCTSNVYKLRLSDGLVLAQFNAGRKTSVQGLAVRRGLTAATAADLSVSLTDQPDPVSPSTAQNPTFVLYRSSVANGGPGQARSVTVTLSTSGGGAIDIVQGSGWSCAPTTASSATCILQSNLPAGSVAPPINLVVQTPVTTTPTTMAATASVIGNEPDQAPGNDTDAEQTSVDAAGTPDRFFTFCPPNRTCTATTPPGPDDNTTSSFTVPADPDVFGILSVEDVTPTFTCTGGATNTQETLFTLPDGFSDAQHPIVAIKSFVRAGSGVSPNDPICVLKPGGTPMEIPPCLMAGIAQPSPCEDGRGGSRGVLSVTILIADAFDPRFAP